MVYVLDDARREEIIADLATRMAAVEGVQAVLTSDQFGELGQPTSAEDPRAPDLWLAAESGYSFTDSDAGDEVLVARETPGGTHGYLPDQPDMWGTLVISGYGVRTGEDLGQVPNINVAPTIARLLGVEMPTAEGEVIEEALVDE